MSNNTALKVWFKTARQVHLYLTCPIGEDFMWGNSHTETKEKGVVYEVSEKTVYNHTNDKDGNEKLRRNRAGRFAKRTVDIYAKTHLSKVVSDADPAADDETPLSGTQGVAAERMAADAEMKRAAAQLKALELKRALGQTVSTAVVERDNGERAQALKLHLSSFMRDFAPELLSHVGGDVSVAHEIIEIVDGDPEKVEKLSGFIYSRRPLLLDSFKRRLQDALNVYARGEWFNDEMRAAWEKLEAYRRESEAMVAAELVSMVGGNAELLPQALDRFEVVEREV